MNTQFIPEFKRRVDNHSFMTGNVSGHSGPIAYIFSNSQDGKNYFVSWKNDFFMAFSRICKIPNGGIGQSFSETVLDLAVRYPHESWLVAAMPIDGMTFYGIQAKELLGWSELNPSCVRTIDGEISRNISIPVKRLLNMEDFNTY